jgi:hypothetical protein
MADVKLTQEQAREADELIKRNRELLHEMSVSFDDPERFLAARYEWKQKSDRLDAILPPVTEPLD